MTVLEAALSYHSKGFSLIPLKIDKRPALPTWKEYQTSQPDIDTLNRWWGNGSTNNIGIVTGAVSGIVVVDVDDMQIGAANLSKYIPLGIKTPTAKTPTGGLHLYFKHPGVETNNKAGVIPGTDFRGDGGYIVAPPSHCEYDKAGTRVVGDYEWILSIFDAPLADLPPAYIECILHFLYTHGVDTSGRTFFVEGTRDQDIFHLANCLVKGGSEPDFTKQVLNIVAESCQPPFPPTEVAIKLTSAIERANRRERNLTDEISDYVLSTSGDFVSTDVHKNLDLSTRVHKKTASTVLARLVEQGVIERVGSKNGVFRRIDKTMVEQCWWEDDGQPLNLRFPLGVEDFVRVFPGNIILLEGGKSQGKTAFALEFVRLNAHLFGDKALYQNVEMANSELLDRFKAYGDVLTPEQWRRTATFIRQTSSWQDKVKPDGLNVIDYLIEYNEPYLMPDFIWKIHQKLKSGIALIIVQRDPLKPYPVGGRGVRDIPRLVLSLVNHRLKLEDVKSFKSTEYGNPTGLVRKYKQVSWWRFKADGEWFLETEEKYADFPKEKRR